MTFAFGCAETVFSYCGRSMGKAMDFRVHRSLRILVADGQEASRRFLSLALHEIGLDCVQASDARETIDILGSLEVHGLVLDNDLPNLGGLETIRVIGTFGRVPPYLLLASILTRELQMAALDWRATSVIPKPVDSGVFSEIVRTMLVREYGNSL